MAFVGRLRFAVAPFVVNIATHLYGGRIDDEGYPIRQCHAMPALSHVCTRLWGLTPHIISASSDHFRSLLKSILLSSYVPYVDACIVFITSPRWQLLYVQCSTWYMPRKEGEREGGSLILPTYMMPCHLKMPRGSNSIFYSQMMVTFYAAQSESVPLARSRKFLDFSLCFFQLGKCCLLLILKHYLI